MFAVRLSLEVMKLWGLSICDMKSVFVYYRSSQCEIADFLKMLVACVKRQ